MNNDDLIFLLENFGGKIDDFITNCNKLSKSDVDFLHSGNLSLRLNSNFLVIKPSGVSYSQISKDALSIVNIKTGETVKGLTPSSDLAIHIAIYKDMPHIESVIHTHSHFATVMSILGEDLKVHSTLHADYFGEPLRCLPYMNHRKNNVGEQVLSNNIKNACLLEKHGVICFSESPERSIEFAFVVEEISRLYFHALSVNRGVSVLSEKDTNILNEYYHNKYGK